MLTFSSCWVRGWSSASWSTLSTWESGLPPHTFLGASSCSPPICITSPAVCSEMIQGQRGKRRTCPKLLFWGICVCPLSRRRNSPMVVMHVCSRVCWATEGTSGTPASHFFRSPPDAGLFSGHKEKAKAALVSPQVCWVTGKAGSSAASHFFRSPFEGGCFSVSDWFFEAAGLDSSRGGTGDSTSSTGLWVFRFWFSLRRICFFSLYYRRIKYFHLSQPRIREDSGFLRWRPNTHLDHSSLWFRQAFL